MDIVVIPDTQVKRDVRTEHLYALGLYIVEHKPDVILHIGDHWDMPSLSIYDMGKIANEGARYQDDITVGIQGISDLELPINTFNFLQKHHKKKQYNPRKVFLVGNHENRIKRHVESHPILEGKLDFFKDSYLEDYGWEVYDFLEVVEVEGVKFSHYFVNPESAKRYTFSGSPDHQLRILGHSFVQGHKQGLHVASPRFYADGKVTRGVICGSFYQHNEVYMGPQGNDHWRGALHLKEVKDGNFNLIEIPLEMLIRDYL